MEYLTLTWNVAGAAVVLWAAWRAHSVALASFGLDSVIEIGASMVVIRQLGERGHGRGRERDRSALRLIALSFFALAVYVSCQAALTLGLNLRPIPSWPGVVWLTLTLVAMLALALGKEHTGRRLGSAVLRAEARVTRVDAYLAGAVLGGMLLHAGLGWWWADLLAAGVVGLYAWREGRHAWREGCHLWTG